MAEVIPSFNLLISTAADFEEDCFNEVWYQLFALGDENPIFINLYIPGLIGVCTKVDPRKFIHYLKDQGQKKGLNYFKFIFKVIPIDSVVTTDKDEIIKRSGELIDEYRKLIKETDSFRVKIVRRFTELKAESLISVLAKMLTNKVNLKKPDWEIRVEICRKLTGISILREDEIFEPKKQKIDSPAPSEPST